MGKKKEKEKKLIKKGLPFKKKSTITKNVTPPQIK